MEYSFTLPDVLKTISDQKWRMEVMAPIHDTLTERIDYKEYNYIITFIIKL